MNKEDEDNLKIKNRNDLNNKSKNDNSLLQSKVDDLELQNFKLRNEVNDLSIKIHELVF